MPKKIGVPIVGANASPRSALKAMRDHGAAAVIVPTTRGHKLVFGGDIATAHDRGTRDLAAIRKKHDVPTSPVAQGRSARGPVAGKSSLLEFRRTNKDVRFVLGSATVNRGVVVSLRETYALKSGLVMPEVLRCTGPTTHYFPEPRVSIGVRCPFCTVKNSVVRRL